jgi:Stress responsive A/B Barrel Domain
VRRPFSKILLVTVLAVAALFVGPAFADEGPVRHIVIFKYTDQATPEQIQEITDAFRDLKNKIPGILSFEYGRNNSPEGYNRGLTHAYVLTFENAAARDAYLPHPAHASFGELLGESGIFEEAFVFDFSPQE